MANGDGANDVAVLELERLALPEVPSSGGQLSPRAPSLLGFGDAEAIARLQQTVAHRVVSCSLLCALGMFFGIVAVLGRLDSTTLRLLGLRTLMFRQN